ncbi:MAG: peptidylprolyl isomerase [Bacteroidetes bacterium]|nr:peptidylprolyl isomerase [Bacteroidota bacterium]
MGMMTKMRDNAHVFIMAFAVVFVAFWVFSDLDIGSLMQGSMNEIGNIGGKAISYQEFQDVVERVSEQRKDQNKGRELTENDYMQIREQVWNDFVTQAIVEQAIEDFGISVADQEITDWVFSENPPEQLTQYFKDSTGQFNRDAYNQFLQNPGPENQQALVAIESQLRSELLRTKLTNILTSSVIVPESSVRSKFIEQNTDFVSSYVFFDPRVFAAKDTAAPTQDEYETYYDKNKERFKTEDMRKIKFVLFPEIPSKSDTAAIANELSTIKDLAASGTDFLELVENNSEEQYDSARWFTRDQVAADVAKEVFSQPVGSVVGPVPNETGLSVYKVMAEKNTDNVMYHAAHILLRTDGGQDEAAQKAKALTVLAKAKAGEDFAKLAAQYSEEPGAAERGGDLSWFGKGRMVKEFEDAVFGARPGDIKGLVKTQFGFHIIKVFDRSSREVKLAEVRMAITAGSGTKDALYERARDFAYFANENGFEAEAAAQKLQVQETPEFAQQTGSYIPNIGTNPALVKFAFEYGVGQVSEVHRSSNGYVVAMVSEERPAGYRPIEEVKEQIKPQVVYDRQMKNTLKKAREIAGTGKSLEQIVGANPTLTIANTPPYKIQSGVPNVGADQAFIGKMLGLKVGGVTAPFIGQRGIYVARLDSKSAFDETAYKVKKDEIRQQQLSSVQNEFIQSWIEQKRKEIDIVDNRDKFFR